MQSMKAGERGRLGILDAQRETRFAADHVHVERADGEARTVLVAVRIGTKLLRLRRFSVNQETGGEAAGGSGEGHARALEMEDTEMGGIPGGRIAGGKTDLVVRGGAEWVVAGL